ncbi:MAG TPA: DUF2161 family putative PD-(D/E)XK-type phosphodiesterase [Candidatus Hydrogenedentes bacterium]|nr:DUF2161 family putative PD-(D/E)XK-type phosphodiesterase [Candidatus Hydrogenedentota bacterium]HRK33119.1 DUF2161 family putative PD-(D/E)XK-type phosphodiesterase [Candidatus Hydrogenedentota bacterium]
MKRPLRESDLYLPLRAYLETLGYTVRAEVHGCDVAATKDEELVLIELKLALNVSLLVQGVERQRATDSVYVAIPRPKGSAWTRQWRGVRRLLRRLELGLIFIAPRSRVRPVEIVLHPEPYAKRKRAKTRRSMIEEMAGRSGDYNTGGSTRRKLVTAYRENALRIAHLLAQNGPMTTRALRAIGTGPKTTAILYDDVYKWFQRVSLGTYALTEKGKSALTEYADLVSTF